MKKPELKRLIRELSADLQAADERTRDALAAAKTNTAKLTAEVENMRANWRPVPITHEWQPRSYPRCTLCDEPRDAARHQVGGLMRVAVVPQLPDPLDAEA